MKKALYTLDAYPPEIAVDHWFTRVSRVRNQNYATRHGASYVHIEVESPNRRPPHYHKLEVFEHFLQSDFDRGVFFDMDIFVENEGFEKSLWMEYPEGVAMCFDYQMPIGANYYAWCQTTYGPGEQPKIKYTGPTKHDNPKESNWRYFNTGVVVFDRAFAQFMVDHLKPMEQQPEEADWIQYVDGWGEQHNVNYWLDKLNYPVNDLPRDWNELCGPIFPGDQGKYASHYAAPSGRLLLAQRELHGDQGSFQRKYLKGEILNVGCNTDYARLKEDFGAYNIDINHVDSLTGIAYPLDEKMDARKLNPEWTRKFDTVVLGEILEHMGKEDRMKTLMEAMRVTKKAGWINITIPHDDRPIFDQHSEPTHETDKLEYAPGISNFHAFVFTDEMMREDLADLHLEIIAYEKMQYGWGTPGSCYLVCKPAHRQRIRDAWDQFYETPHPLEDERVWVNKDVPVEIANIMYGHQGIDWQYSQTS